MGPKSKKQSSNAKEANKYEPQIQPVQLNVYTGPPPTAPFAYPGQPQPIHSQPQPYPTGPGYHQHGGMNPPPSQHGGYYPPPQQTAPFNYPASRGGHIHYPVPVQPQPHSMNHPPQHSYYQGAGAPPRGDPNYPQHHQATGPPHTDPYFVQPQQAGPPRGGSHQARGGAANHSTRCGGTGYMSARGGDDNHARGRGGSHTSRGGGNNQAYKKSGKGDSPCMVSNGLVRPF